jgi:hypothetical protein
MRRPPWIWVITALVIIAIIALIAYARNEPGIDDRVPDPEDVMSIAFDGDRVTS